MANKANGKAPVPRGTGAKSVQKVSAHKTSGAKSEKTKPSKNPDSLGNQILLCVIGLAGILLGLCFILTDMKKGFDGLTGPVGYSVCVLFYGLFGIGAFSIPFLVLIYAGMWKHSLASHRTFSKAVIIFLISALISSLCHLIAKAAGSEMLAGASFWNVDKMWNCGVSLAGGGVLGGFIGGFLNFAVKVIAWPIVIIALIVSLMALFEMTPNMIAYLISSGSKASAEKHRKKQQERKAAAAEKRAEREADAQKKQAEAEERARQLAEKEEEFRRKHDIVTDIKLDDGRARKSDASNKKKNVPTDIYDNEIIADGTDEPADVENKEEKEAAAKENEQIKPSDTSVRTEKDIDIDDIFTYEGQKKIIDHAASRVHTSTDINGNEQVDESHKSSEITIESETKHRSDPSKPQQTAIKATREKVINKDEEQEKPGNDAYNYPPLSLLSEPDISLEPGSDRASLDRNGRKLVETLRSFKVDVDISNISQGPTITRYELVPKAGVRVRSIANLVDDIALSLETQGIRIEAPIPGKAAVGIEVPNKEKATVYLRELIDTDTFRKSKSKLLCCLGKDVGGEPVYLDVAKMPHLLIAGTTGSGKSVCINTLLMSLLYRATPEEVKLILIDPKKIELNIYNKLPHLLVPVVSQPKMAAGSLAWAVTEMERRFELIEDVGVRDIAGYNKVTENDPDREFLPQIVIVIDELADLMMTAPDDVETSICRIAQKARAAGMHLIIGTQRPSVDVITGLIKANVPSRIAFTVASVIDSRTIIDVAGAEKLIGRGDMLFNPVGAMKPIRVQGAFVSDNEVERVTSFIKEQASGKYDEKIIKEIDQNAKQCGQKKKADLSGADSGSGMDELDEKFYEAVEVALETGKISTSLMQRRLSVGYGRAAKIIDEMAARHIVSQPDGQKPRTLLITRDDWAQIRMRMNDNTAEDAPTYEAEEEADDIPAADEDRPFTEDDFDDDAPF